MPKDRAAPFSPKHRRYWITVTGGMILIGGINLVVGMCSYKKEPPPPTPIQLKLPSPGEAHLLPGSLRLGDVPAPVVRAFAIKYPKTIAAGAFRHGDTYTLIFPPGRAHKQATFRADGTFVSDE